MTPRHESRGAIGFDQYAGSDGSTRCKFEFSYGGPNQVRALRAAFGIQIEIGHAAPEQRVSRAELVVNVQMVSSGRNRGMAVEHEFEVRNDNPKFLCRTGPAFALGKTGSQQKLCFTSTRRDLLARHLLELSRRADCVFVKFGVNARGGMYLGRCFLLTDRAVGEVWAEYKNHPALFCTVQDDDFVAAFREFSNTCDDLWLDDDTKSTGNRTG